MANLQLVKQLRKDSNDLDQLFRDENDSRHLYDEFVLGVSEKYWGKTLRNGKKFDSNTSLSLFETALSIDQRIISQAIETSYLRTNFMNYKNERIFDEYTGINPSELIYVPQQIAETGFNGTTNRSGKIKQSTVPNEIKTIKAFMSAIRRPILQFQEGFELSLNDLEYASFRNIPLQDQLAKRVARDLMMEEQDFAFNYQAPGTNVSPEENGLLFNTAVSSSITWTAGHILDSATTGRAIIDEFVRIRGEILAVTKNVFAGDNQPLCVLMSVANANAMTRTYSDLEGKDALSYLTDREFRIAGLPILSDTTAIFYYKNYENIEISTARMVEAQAQSYNAKTTSWFFPYRNVTAGLTVKRPSAIYKVTGLN